jgi:hypothetical protein
MSCPYTSPQNGKAERMFGPQMMSCALF